VGGWGWLKTSYGERELADKLRIPSYGGSEIAKKKTVILYLNVP